MTRISACQILLYISSVVNAYVIYQPNKLYSRSQLSSATTNTRICNKFQSKRSDNIIVLSSSSSETAVEEEEKVNDSSSSNSTSMKTVDLEEEEEEEWEEVEIENLSEQDFYNSEWAIGTVYNNQNDIDETWVRLTIDPDSTSNIATWGDGASGKWSVDIPSQFISITKETFGGWGGKKLWAGVMNDYYYLDGTVRGWGFFRPASILGQWQMKRLGVSDDERGVAPWFEEDWNENDDNEEEDGEMNDDGDETKNKDWKSIV